MSNRKGIAQMEKLVRPYGLTLKRKKGGHIGIFNGEGKRVGTMSSLPKVNEYALYNSVRQLIDNNALPEEVLDKVVKK